MAKPRPSIGTIALLLASALLLALAFPPLVGIAQQLVEGNRLKLAEYYPAPHETQMKSLVQGEKARPQGPGRTFINQAKIETYHTNGEPEVIIEAPECLLDQTHHTLNSPGPLKVKTADGKFLIEGEGFLWQQTNSVLFISNRVYTLVRPELLATQSTNPPTTNPESGAKGIEIFSDSFNYAKDSGVGVYHDNVRAVGTNMALTTKTLTLVLPMKEHQLESVTADNDVVMDYEGIHATGDHANYEVANGMAHVTGNPAWRAQAREGRGDELIIDRTNRIFTADGHAYLKMPAASMGSAGFFPQQTSTGTAKTTATNGFVEIVSDKYVVLTNLAVFQKKVQVTETEDQQLRGGMVCSLLTVKFIGTNQLESMLAETNVVIEQHENDATNQFAAARAFYTASNNIMELTGSPTWQSGLRQGKADLLLVNLQKNTLDARSNAWMRLPASELGESLPGSASKGASAGTVAKTNEFADVYSHEYIVSPENAFFHDEVRILHPSMHWTCEEVSVAFPAEAGANAMPQNATSQKKISMVADRRVAFVLTDPSSGRKVNGTCDTAYYDYAASAKGTNDVFRLTGNPILTTTNGTVKNKIIILDNPSKKLIVPGKYVISGTVAGGRTNAFQLPKM